MHQKKLAKKAKYVGIIHLNAFREAVGRAIARRRGYAEIALRALVVQPLGPPTSLILSYKPGV